MSSGHHDFPAALRRLSPRQSVFGDPATSLQGVNTFQLPSGALCWTLDPGADYVFDRFSTQATSTDDVVAPDAGPGRWIKRDELMLSDSRFDPFGRLRVSDPATIFDAKTLYDGDALRFVNDVASGGSVTFQSQRSSMKLAVTTTLGSRATRQTKRYLNYQPGKGQQIFATFVMTNGQESGVAKRVGYYDDDNGVFLQVSGGGTSVVLRTDLSGAPVDTVVDQSDWNLDKLDGTGPSGLTFEAARAQILVLDFQWLGTGRVRIGFDLDGKIVYVHEFLNANVGTSVYMRTPNLPVRWEIETVGAAVGAPEMEAICCTVASEGGRSAEGLLRAADMGVAVRNVSTDLLPLISMRLKASHNRATVFPRLATILETGNQTSRWVILINPTITGGTAASWVPVADSAVEYDISRDGALSEDGIKIASGYTSKDVDVALAETVESQLVLASDFAGTPDQLVVGVQTLAASENFAAALQWLEQ